MKIDYNSILDMYRPNTVAISKGNSKFFCPTCHKTLDEKNFFKTRRTDKHPSGYLPECRTCITMKVDDTDVLTFLPILKEIDIPYKPSEWRKLLNKKPEGGASIIGKYTSLMRMNQYNKYRWADTENLVKEEHDSLVAAYRQEDITESEAQQRADADQSLEGVSGVQMRTMTNSPPPSVMFGLTPETSKYNLTQKEIDDYKVKWGEDYTEDQYLQLEQLFNDMCDAYLIQDPIAISNAKMICKLTIKMNRFIDIDDVESSSKISRQLDTFIKTANLAPVQQKDRQQTTFAISQLAFLVEREGGFIPEFYVEEPNDKIDQILADMQEYTEFLVRGETNIAEMVEHTEEILAQDKLPEAVEDYDDFAALEAELLGEMAAIEEAQGEE